MKLRLLPGALAAVLLLMPIVASAQNDTPKSAKTVSFPADHPLISVSIPDGWKNLVFGKIFKVYKDVASVSINLKDKVSNPQEELEKALEYAEGQGVKYESRGEEFELNGMKGFTAKGSCHQERRKLEDFGVDLEPRWQALLLDQRPMQRGRYSFDRSGSGSHHELDQASQGSRKIELNKNKENQMKTYLTSIAHWAAAVSVMIS